MAASYESEKTRHWIYLWVFLLLCTSDPRAHAGEPDPLILSTLPPAQELAQGVRNESEHRAVPVRKYWLDGPLKSQDVGACVLHPLGQVDEVPLGTTGEGVFLSYAVPMADGPMHGVHNTYVVERSVTASEQLIRIAKRITIHHSCSWGHDYKYDRTRIEPRSLASIPLEITCSGLWDANFHSKVRSGDSLRATVTHYGKPAAGARVRVISGKGWTKDLTTDEDGTASLQLIRDYYPSSWSDFGRDFRDRFILVAEYTTEESGELNGRPFERTRHVSTLTWVYSPSREDYASHRSGLYIGLLVLAVAGIGVYAYRERRTRPFKEVRLSERD